MAYQIKIAFASQPEDFKFFSVDVVITALSYTGFVEKTFLPYGPVLESTQFSVSKGVDLGQTRSRLLANLQEFDTNSMMQFTADEEFIYLNVLTDEEVTYTVGGNIDGLTHSGGTGEDPEGIVLDPIELHDIMIDIIDTYDNDRSMVVELTQKSAPKLVWDGGDDITQVMQNSRLSFNMWVDDSADGAFYHLFTGDERRYKVKIYSVWDDPEYQELIWQGFLLPDLLREPYLNGGFFVSFEAVDMLGSLKGKIFKPWYYQNKFPIMRLLGNIMAFTGLDQPFIVVPSLLPAMPGVSWENINVPLMHYADGEKYEDCYKILTDVLSPHGMTICSYRGYWFLKGITRKHEMVHEDALLFSAAGYFQSVITVNNRVVDFFMKRQSVSLTGLPPWRRVNVKLDAAESDNLFSPWVVAFQGGEITSQNVPISSINYGRYTVGYFFNWPAQSAIYTISVDDPGKFSVNIAADSGYQITEASSLFNYFECREKPFIFPNVQYELRIEGSVKFWLRNSTTVNYFKNNFLDDDTLPNNVHARTVFNFQLLINGTELASNRGSHPGRDRYEVNVRMAGVEDDDALPFPVGIMDYTITGIVKAQTEGYLTARILMPQWFNGPAPPATLILKGLEVREFEMKKKVQDDLDEDVVATRPVDFTKELEYEIGFACTKNGYVRNNFGVAPLIPDSEFHTVEWGTGSTRTLHQDTVYSDTYTETTGVIVVRRHQISGPTLFMDLFGHKRLFKKLFVQRAGGEEERFDWVACFRTGFYLVYIQSTSLFPEIPDDFRPLAPLAGGDQLKYMHLRYPEENVFNLEKWKIHGFSGVDKLSRCLARALHCIRPETTFALDGEHFGLITPQDVIVMNYMGVARHFVPTRIGNDLYGGKAAVRAVEGKLTDLDDIVYE